MFYRLFMHSNFSVKPAYIILKFWYVRIQIDCFSVFFQCLVKFTVVREFIALIDMFQRLCLIFQEFLFIYYSFFNSYESLAVFPAEFFSGNACLFAFRAYRAFLRFY